ncbi:MAG: hypothetical protein Q8868_04905 [Bacteroidota bacterium]|nr:hypothetical protein [Bacteroidota bacterium]
MKRIVLILTAIFLVSVISSFQPAASQEKSKEEKEKELKMQEEITQQKKELEKMKQEQINAMEDQKAAVEDAMKEAQKQVEAASKYKDMVKVFKGNGDRGYFNGEPFLISPGVEPFVWHGFGDNDNHTTWDFSKSMKEGSFTRDYTFDVEPASNTVVMSVNGDCKSGEIRIKIVMPNGKTYSDILIDEFGNLNWRKSFTISEEENKDKAGAWKFQINASKATGYFKISLQTY